MKYGESTISLRKQRRLERAKALFRNSEFGKCSKPLTLQEAALAIGTAPEKLNDIFRGRKSGTIRISLDFQEYELNLKRRAGLPPLIPASSIYIISRYMRLKETVWKSGEFERVSKHLSRKQKNMEMLFQFVRSRVREGNGCPCIFPLPESRKCPIPVHEFNGKIYPRPEHARVIVSLMRFTYGTESSVAKEFDSLRKEANSHKSWGETPQSLGIRLWFLREMYSSGILDACTQPGVMEGIERFLGKREIARFFSKTWETYL